MSTQSTGPPTGEPTGPHGPRVLVISTSGAAELVDWPGGEREQLSTINAAVGGYFETIGTGAWVALINEDGKRLHLRPNPHAEALARRLGWAFREGDYLVGPVVFCSRNGLELDDVPAEVVELARLQGTVGS
jgi:hypothetical protein